ncbi:unnamed protein product [Notodromas monacha]|uniref:Uncharacterized protein n=1 Tax=Notodromas monacha TaxID=399045 RepID=A0A7R9GIH2_9CRUS|nr:unnamed protein product [Notodromas monacha]CAG0921769.1 unnamed protein product [Notodromas monacha]
MIPAVPNLGGAEPCVPKKPSWDLNKAPKHPFLILVSGAHRDFYGRLVKSYQLKKKEEDELQ